MNLEVNFAKKQLRYAKSVLVDELVKLISVNVNGQKLKIQLITISPQNSCEGHVINNNEDDATAADNKTALNLPFFRISF